MDEVPRILSRLDERVSRWDTNGLVYRVCPFCESNGRERFVRPDGLIVCACGSCGALYVSPCPSETQLDLFYETYHQEHRTGSFRNPKRLLRQIARLQPEDDYRVMEIVSMMNPRGARILDFGCGLGEFLHIFRQLGAEVHGVDLDPDAVSFVRNELGIDSVRCASADALEDNARYDLIILHDLIEHPLFPFDILQKCSRLLRNGGLLFIWTPNATFALEEDEPTILRVDLEHMQYMHAKTVQHVSERLGLDVVHLESAGFVCSTEFAGSQRNASAVVRLTRAAKGLARDVPGFRYARLVRDALFPTRSERMGNYHLFAILKKGMSESGNR